MRVHLEGFVLTDVAQDAVELGEAVLVVDPAALEHDGQVFVGAQVVKAEGADLEPQRPGKRQRGRRTDRGCDRAPSPPAERPSPQGTPGMRRMITP